MKDAGQLSRVNYSLAKHHRERLREQIDPRTIEKIEVAANPSLNYRNAFKAVYHDQLEKTIEFQMQKKKQERETVNYLQSDSLSNSRSHQNLGGYYSSPLQNTTNNQSNCQNNRRTYKNLFTDYNEQKNKKIDYFVNSSFNGGTFFRQQDQYQKRRQEESEFTKRSLQQQLKLNENKKLQAVQEHYREIEEVKQNRNRQVEQQQYRELLKRHNKEMFGEQIKQQIQDERIKRGRKSYFEYQNMARHNPITNPIEYHIDNPYIMHKFQNHTANYP